ncbi:MAG: peptidyl-prolyl cis-trans isomerase [candidate division Zixibacteria bacterium]|nr:peptidyl-prolyl cis-trans isomerase [candidate division Zixibacteria bacterium]
MRRQNTVSQAKIAGGLLLAALCITSRSVPCRAEDNPVLATFAGNSITAAEVITKAHERSLLRPQPFSDTALIRELVDDVLIDSLISRISPKIDLSTQYAFWADVRRGVTGAASQLFQNDILGPKLKFDSSQIAAFYQGHLARYMVPHQQRYVRNITIYYPMEKVPKTYNATPDPLYEGWNPQAVIEALYARLADGEDFATLAAAHSEEPRTKGAGGDIGWVSKESLPDDEFGKMCLEIPLYKISKPFTSRIGWHIVQATAIREPGPAPIDGPILQDILTYMRDSVGASLGKELVDSLTGAGTLQILDGTLGRADSTWKPNTPLAIANGRDTILAAEYLDNVSKLRARNKPVPRTLDEKRELVQSMLPALCMYDAMRKLGYLTKPEVIAKRAAIIRTRAEAAAYAQMSDAQYVPDSAEVERYFRAHAAEYARPASYMVRFLRLPDQMKAQSLADAWKAGNAPDSVESRWVEKADVPAGVWNALTKMSEGGVTDAIAGNGDYWVVTLAQKSAPPSVTDVAGSIRAKLQRDHDWKRRQEWIRTSGAPYGITRYPERISRVKLPSAKDAPRLAKPASGAEWLPSY